MCQSLGLFKVYRKLSTSHTLHNMGTHHNMNLLNTHSHLTDHLLQSEHIPTCTDCNSLYNALAVLVLMTVLPNSTLGITSLLGVTYAEIPLTDMDVLRKCTDTSKFLLIYGIAATFQVME